MMRKKTFRLLICVMLITSLVSTPIGVSAGNIYKGFSNGTYNKFVCNPIWGVYRYWVHKYSKTGTIINSNRLISVAFSHTKGKNTKTITSSGEFAYTYSKTTTWNNRIGADYGISDTVKLSAEADYGETTGWGVTAKVCNSVTVSIPKNAKTGVYALAAGMPFYKMRVKKFNWITDKLKKTSYFYMPYGTSVVYTVYSTDNQQTWKVYD